MARSTSKNRLVKNIFTKLALYYDSMEKSLHWNKGEAWRQKAIELAQINKASRILDLCTGTGSMAVQLSQHLGATSQIVAIDICKEMLNIAKKRVSKLNLNRRIECKLENAEIMPFPDEFFDVVYIAFGMRFVSDVQSVLEEIYRVLRSQGKLIILELTNPKQVRMQKYTKFIREQWLPLKYRIKYRLSPIFTHYLHDSLVYYPTSEKFKEILINNRFSEVKCEYLNRRLATIHVARK